MNKFELVSQAKKDYEAAVRAVSKGDIVELLTPLFEKFPEVKAVRWRQYTPYFNDGDPCWFSVRDAFLQYADLDEEAGDYEDGFESYFEDAGRQDAMKAFDQALAIDQDIMLRVFGDHSKITVDRDGVTVDEYHHD